MSLEGFLEKGLPAGGVPFHAEVIEGRHWTHRSAKTKHNPTIAISVNGTVVHESQPGPRRRDVVWNERVQFALSSLDDAVLIQVLEEGVPLGELELSASDMIKFSIRCDEAHQASDWLELKPPREPDRDAREGNAGSIRLGIKASIPDSTPAKGWGNDDHAELLKEHGFSYKDSQSKDKVIVHKDLPAPLDLSAVLRVNSLSELHISDHHHSNPKKDEPMSPESASEKKKKKKKKKKKATDKGDDGEQQQQPQQKKEEQSTDASQKKKKKSPDGEHEHEHHEKKKSTNGEHEHHEKKKSPNEEHDEKKKKEKATVEVPTAKSSTPKSPMPKSPTPKSPTESKGASSSKEAQTKKKTPESPDGSSKAAVKAKPAAEKEAGESKQHHHHSKTPGQKSSAAS